MSLAAFIRRSRIGRPVVITLAEECPVCCWCGTPISPTKQKLNYPDGRLAHMKCPAPLQDPDLVQSPVTGAIGTRRKENSNASD